MINITNKKECSGCTACASICPHSAIEMNPDVLGFKYPEVDKNKCVDCGLCDKVCAFKDNYDKTLNLPEPIAYAARHKNMYEIKKSRSGAAFIAVSDWILENGGCVYGAGYKGHFVVTHKRATTKEERDEFRGSKYVQSDLSGIFKQVKDDLRQGLIVMFSGTPCQTSGLNAFVGKSLRENLYLVDLVCHGVPGPFMWRDYLKYIEKKYNRDIIAVNFRDKEHYGWSDHKETFRFAGCSGFKTSTIYTYAFYQHIALRQSCAVCHFTNLIRPSDLTLADYWGSERTDANFNADDNGCSLLLCNTEKGKVLFESVKNQMNVIPAMLENVMLPNLEHPSIFHKDRLNFEQDYEKYGFEKTMKRHSLMGWKYCVNCIKRKIIHCVIKIIGKKGVDVIKKIKPGSSAFVFQ